MVPTNEHSWNLDTYYEECREAWESTANAALARIGSDARIDRRSLLERGLSRLPEPALRLAWYLNELTGVMRHRFGQFQVARHMRGVEERAKASFAKMEAKPGLPGEDARKTARFFGWFDRQLSRLAPDRTALERGKGPEHGLDR